MKTSDWIIIGTALFLGVTALVVPWLAELVKRKAFKPKLEVSFEHKPPFSHKTRYQSGQEAYFSRFLVENTGKSQARLCEAVVEDLWIYDASGRPIKYDNFSPVNLKWVVANSPQVIDIQPRRRIFCSIAHLSSPVYQQQTEKPHQVDIPGCVSSAPKFMLDQREYYYAQPNCFPPGKYGIRVMLFSENSSPQEAHYEISWSGNWKTSETEMLRELVVRSVEGFEN